MEKKIEITKLTSELEKDYSRWIKLFERGGSDPFNGDGYNLNLIRRQIAADKQKLETVQSEGEKPEAYFRPLPPEVPDHFIIRSRELWFHAINTYQTYKLDENYRYLCQVYDTLSADIIKKSSIDAVIGYVTKVERALQEKDFVVLRIHEKPDTYLDSFKECRMRVEKMVEKDMQAEEGQLDLFQIGLGRHGKMRQ